MFILFHIIIIAVWCGLKTVGNYIRGCKFRINFKNIRQTEHYSGVLIRFLKYDFLFKAYLFGMNAGMLGGVIGKNVRTFSCTRWQEVSYFVGCPPPSSRNTVLLSNK